MLKRFFFIHLIFSVLFASLLACGIAAREPLPDSAALRAIPNPSTQVAIRELSSQAALLASQDELHDIEVLWAVPAEQVEGYIVRYGANKTALDNEIRLLREQIEQLKDPRYGPVFRHTIANVSADQPVFIKVIAFDGELFSEPSAVYKAPAELTH